MQRNGTHLGTTTVCGHLRKCKLNYIRGCFTACDCLDAFISLSLLVSGGLVQYELDLLSRLLE